MSNLNLDVMQNTNTAAGIGTGYDLTKKILLQQDVFARSKIQVHASLLEVQLDNISGATKITCCLSRDAAGDNFVLTETQTNIQSGLTTSSKGTAQIKLDVIIKDLDDNILYLHIKTNAGSISVSSAGLTFRY